MPNDVSTNSPSEPGPDFNAALLTARYPDVTLILHNDDVHGFAEVVQCLVALLPLAPVAANEAVHAIHTTGQATLLACKQEEAEYHQERLALLGLRTTIEAVRATR